MDNEIDLKELASELTKNQRIFCDEYLIDRNGSRAYKIAYPNVKKDAAAEAGASRLLRTVKVSAYVKAKLEELSHKAGVTVARVLQEEERLAYSDIRQLFEGECTIPPSELPEDIGRALGGVKIRERDIRNSDGHVVETIRTYEYKLIDKGAALARLEKHLGMYQPDDGGLAEGLGKLGERLAKAIERSAIINQPQ
jgi:phage terminase small subunit